MNLDNPASRLVQILQASTTIPHDTKCQKAWEQLLCSSPNNISELYILLGNLMTLPQEVANLVSIHIPSQISNIQIWKSPIDKAFSTNNLLGSWQSFTQHINNNCVIQLSLIAELLHTRIGNPPIDLEKLSALREELSSIQEKITNSEISESLKIYLTREISKIIQLIREHAINGYEPILNQVDSMFGHLVRDQEYRSFIKDEELGKRLLDSLTAMANMITISCGMPQLTVAFAGLLN